MTFDVLIIGGGPAGATAGLMLARAGWSTVIVEKKNFPRRKVCGEFISATNLPLMRELGIADFYMTHGGPEVRRVGLFAANCVVTSAMPPTQCSLGNWGRAFGREHLDNLLLNEARRAGATIWQPWGAQHLQKHKNYFTCTIKNNKQSAEISARMVIMANGSWERGLIQDNTPSHKSSDFLAFKAHFRNCELDNDLMPLIVFPGGYGGLVHSDSGRVTLSCCIRRDALQYVREKNLGLQAGDAVLQHITSTCAGASTVLTHAEREDSWLSAGPIRPGIRARYDSGIFFVGNIAGEAHPVVAEGISMAMQSAGLLAQLLVARQKEVLNDQNFSDAGRDYTKKWHSHFATRIRAAALFAQLAIRPQAVTLLLPIIKRFPGILTYGAKLSGKCNNLTLP
jgi:flavin-dependent dehydrogenase